MQLWEYKTASMGSHSENDMGQDGWELVAVHDGIMFYKRPVAVPPAAAPAAVSAANHRAKPAA